VVKTQLARSLEATLNCTEDSDALLVQGQLPGQDDREQHEKEDIGKELEEDPVQQASPEEVENKEKCEAGESKGDRGWV